MDNSHTPVPSSSVDAAIAAPGLPIPPKPPGECDLFKGCKVKGYGKLYVDGKMQRAHRVAWESANGAIPSGMCLDHLCRNRRCINVAHLELVTPQVNTLRGTGPTATNARKTTCTRGHLFTAENTYLFPDGRRGCRTCKGIREQAYRDARRLRRQDAENGGSEGVHLVARHQGITPTQAAKEWPGLSLAIDRLIARERRKERKKVLRIVTQQITETLRVLKIDNVRFPVSGATLSTIRHLDWQIKQAIKPAKKGAKQR